MIDTIELHKDLTESARSSDDAIYQSPLMPNIRGINIGDRRWKEIIIRRIDNGKQVGAIKTYSCGIQVYGKDGVFLGKTINWPALAFKVLFNELIKEG